MKIIVTSPSFSKNDVLRNELLQYFPDSVFNREGKKLEGPELAEFIKEADGAIIGLERIDDAVLKTCEKLLAIAKYGVGTDNLDLESCERRGIRIGWTAGVNKRSVAELTMAFMVCLIRNINRTFLQLKQGTWNKNGGFDLSGKVIGIIGVGNVGKEVIRFLRPFQCRILVNDIIDQAEYYREQQVKEVTKETIFRESDIVTIHTPLTGETRHLINRQVLSVMKPDAFIINTARGGIIKSEDLKWALLNEVIAGAAIDVYEDEPPVDREFIELPNLLCTPHIGGNSFESILAMGRSAIGHLKGFFLDNTKV